MPAMDSTGRTSVLLPRVGESIPFRFPVPNLENHRQSKHIFNLLNGEVVSSMDNSMDGGFSYQGLRKLQAGDKVN